MGEIRIIVAIGRNGAIGRDGGLIWKIPGDMKRFKSLTMGHPVVMGRKTWESLPKRPLPGRRNIVLTRQEDFMAEGAEVVKSPEEAMEKISDSTAYIIGGAEIYKMFLPYADNLVLTEVDEVCEDADCYLDLGSGSPEFSREWEMTEEWPKEQTAEGVTYRYRNYKRVRNTEG